MAILKRGQKTRRDKHKPAVITGEFELHYEDIINKNRFALVAVLASSLVLIAVFVPSAVYQSTANTERVSIEAESGLLINPERIIKVNGDASASEGSYLEFRLTP